MAIRPSAYVAVLCATLVCLYAYQLRSDGIFACQARYSTDIYLGYCNARAYGDYDHGALWFALEREAVESAAAAGVLFLGSSRMQFGFSTEATLDWFAARSVPHYLLGFSHTETTVFAGPLLEKMAARARVYVINVDGFFEDRETDPVAQIFRADDAKRRYRSKKLWQYPHRVICQTAPRLCGEDIAFYRDRRNGHWTVSASDALPVTGVAERKEAAGDSGLMELVSRAENFVAQLPVSRDCVLMTVVPSPATPKAQANAIAESVGVAFIDASPDGLQTFDGSHLDSRSAELWARAFFAAADPYLRRCLADEST